MYNIDLYSHTNQFRNSYYFQHNAILWKRDLGGKCSKLLRNCVRSWVVTNQVFWNERCEQGTAMENPKEGEGAAAWKTSREAACVLFAVCVGGVVGRKGRLSPRYPASHLGDSCTPPWAFGCVLLPILGFVGILAVVFVHVSGVVF